MNKLYSKYKSLSLPVKAGLWYTFCNFMQRGISIITSPIFTRILTTDEYGTYSLYLSWLNILSIFTCLNLYYGVFNKAMVKYSNDRHRYISSMQGLVLILCFVFTIVYALFYKMFNRFFELSSLMIAMMIIEMALTPMFQFWIGKKRFEYRYRSVVLVTIIRIIANPTLGIAFVLISRCGAEARILATVLIEIIIGGSIMVKQFIKGKAFFVKEYWKYALMFNIPLIPHYLSGSLLNQGDRIVIQKMCGPSDVALYSIGYSISMLSQMVTNALSQAITPWLYDSLEQQKYDIIDKKLFPVMILVAIMCFLMMLFAPEIIWIFASESYRNSVYIVPPIAASVFFIYMYNVYSNFEFYYEKRFFIVIASFSAAALNILLNIIFIPQFGYVAAGYTTLVCYALYAFSHFAFTVYICKKEAGISGLFKFKKLGIVSALVISFSFIASALYKNNYVRYGVIVSIIAILFILKAKIKAFIKEMK